MCPNCTKKMSFKSIIIVLSIVLLGALGQNGLSASNKNSEGRKALTEATQKTLGLVLSANEKLHAAFFSYDAKLIEENALKLKSAIDGIKNEEISKLLHFSKNKLLEIKASSEREANNQNYHLVSMALIYIVNKYDVGSGYNAYSCPMVKKKWLQNSKVMAKVHNPYAPSMPHCGTQDTNY